LSARCPRYLEAVVPVLRRGGRPPVDARVVALIAQMACSPRVRSRAFDGRLEGRRVIERVIECAPDRRIMISWRVFCLL